MRRSDAENANATVRREAWKRIERSGSPARTSSHAGVSRSRGSATKQRFCALHRRKKSIIVSTASRAANCSEVRETTGPLSIRFCARRGADIRMLANKHRRTSGLATICRCKGRWRPEWRHEAATNWLDEAGRRHADVMKPPDRRFCRLRQLIRGVLPR